MQYTTPTQRPTPAPDLTEPDRCPDCGGDLEAGPFGFELVCPNPACAPTAPPTSSARQAGTLWSERLWAKAGHRPDDSTSLATLARSVGVQL